MLISMVVLGVFASIDPLRPAFFALVLSTRRSNAVAFLVGWAVALSVLFTLAFVVLGGDSSEPPGATQRAWASVALFVIGIALLAVATRRWLHRDADHARPVVPATLGRRLEHLDARRAGLLGVLIQPRALTIAAALVCSRDRSDGLDLILGFAVFALVSTGALIGLLLYDIWHPTTAEYRLTELVQRLERNGSRLVTFGSAAAGAYLVLDSVLDLV